MKLDQFTENKTYKIGKGFKSILIAADSLEALSALTLGVTMVTQDQEKDIEFIRPTKIDIIQDAFTRSGAPFYFVDHKGKYCTIVSLSNGNLPVSPKDLVEINFTTGIADAPVDVALITALKTGDDHNQLTKKTVLKELENATIPLYDVKQVSFDIGVGTIEELILTNNQGQKLVYEGIEISSLAFFGRPSKTFNQVAQAGDLNNTKTDRLIINTENFVNIQLRKTTVSHLNYYTLS